MPTTGQPVPPDAEIIFREFIISQTEITDLIGSRVATNLPRDAELPFLVYVRGGGTLVRPTSQVHLQSAVIPCIAFAGQWGGDGTKNQPDYGGAMELANLIIKYCLFDRLSMIYALFSKQHSVLRNYLSCFLIFR